MLKEKMEEILEDIYYHGGEYIVYGIFKRITMMDDEYNWLVDYDYIVEDMPFNNETSDCFITEMTLNELCTVTLTQLKISESMNALKRFASSVVVDNAVCISEVAS